MANEIFKKIPAVMGEIGVIGKARQNKMQGYSFRGIDDVYQAAHGALVKHGIFTVPMVMNMQREERTSAKGGVLLYTILTMKYIFYASDGSHIEAVTIGEAMDSGDKSCNKAMSAAQKYAFLQVFSIPTEEPKDTENETHAVQPKKNKVLEEEKMERDTLLSALNMCESEDDLNQWFDNSKKVIDKFNAENKDVLRMAYKARQEELKEAKGDK